MDFYPCFFSVLVLVFVVYNRRREAQIKYPGPEDDVRENIINYEDEGGGEDDMTAFDITPLQIPIADPSLAHHSLPRQKVHCEFQNSSRLNIKLLVYTRILLIFSKPQFLSGFKLIKLLFFMFPSPPPTLKSNFCRI